VGHQGGRDRAADPQDPAGQLLPEHPGAAPAFEQALLGVTQQAYVCGVYTRRVDQLVESLGLRTSKSEVSRGCGALDEHVDAFRTRRRAGRVREAALAGGPSRASDRESPESRPRVTSVVRRVRRGTFRRTRAEGRLTRALGDEIVQARQRLFLGLQCLGARPTGS
jgi:hypothetical protein